MDFHKIQEMNAQFGNERGWHKFPASQVFTHLIEELGEISRYITIEEGYKAIGLGHDAPKKKELKREFGQVLSLFLQLANHFEIDLEDAILTELKTMADRFPAGSFIDHDRHDP